MAVCDREGEAVLHLAGDIADSSASLFPAGRGPGRPGGLPHGGPGPVPRSRGPAPARTSSSWTPRGRNWPCSHGARGLLADSPPLLLMEMEEKTLAAAGASKAAIQPIPRRLRLPGRASQQRPLVRHRRPGGRQGPQYLLVQSRAFDAHRRKAARLPVIEPQ